jgi:transposase
MSIMKTEQTDFHQLSLYIGLDVHKKQWSISIYTPTAYHRTFSQPPTPKALKNYLDHHFPGAQVVCAYEACKFGYWIQRELSSYGYRCLVVNPADIPTSNKESSEKADPSDSRKIGKALRAGLLNSIHIPQRRTEGDRHLFRYRKKLWADLVRVKNRIKDKFLFTGTPLPPEHDNSNWTKAFLLWLKQVKLPDEHTRLTVDLLLEQYHFLYRHFLKVSIEVRKLQRRQDYKSNAKLLRSIPGIGPLTTVQLLTEIDDINRFKSFKKINSFVGFKPMTHSSGEHDWRGRMTYRQNKSLRSALIECAWTAVSADPIMLQRYEELKKRLTGKRAIIIIARKLLSRIYYVLKNQKPYEIGLAR